MENLVACCRACNDLKGTMLYDEFLELLHELAKERGFEHITHSVAFSTVRKPSIAPINNESKPFLAYSIDDLRARSSVVEHPTFNRAVDGSTPSAHTKYTLRDLRRGQRLRPEHVPPPYRGVVINPVWARLT